MSDKTPVARCRLTGDSGAMARSHLIPDAFMRRASDVPFMESDGLSRSVKRYTGWYDRNLLGTRGEAIIARLDSAAAGCLVGGGFTYRTRRDRNDPAVIRDGFVPGGVYEACNVDTKAIKLFGLSLLWRAAASDHDAMRLVQVRPEKLADLADRILSDDPGPAWEYPVSFSVFCGAEEMTKVAPFQPEGFPFFRFFLDGVICYVSPRRTLLSAKRYGRLLVGTEQDRFPMLCVASDGSRHARLVDGIFEEVRAREGDVFAGFGQRRTTQKRLA